jgi:hypothetical protein
MTGYVPRWQYPRRRPLERSAKARLHLAVSFLLLFVGLILTDVDVQGFQASRGDGTLGTYTVTRITGNDRYCWYTSRGGYGRAPSSNITGLSRSAETACETARRSPASSPSVELTNTRKRRSGVRMTARP